MTIFKKIIVFLVVCGFVGSILILFNVGFFSGDCINLNDVRNYYLDEDENLVIVTEREFEYERGIGKEYHTYIINYNGDDNVNIIK